MTTTQNTIDNLTIAYHTIYDVKDTMTPGSDEFVLAYDALRQVEALIVSFGGDRINRYDAPHHTKHDCEA